MYLHRLTFQAVGPFPGRHTIDFAALGSSGLFLLEGPTGSGKSTVIDAIVFALYGKVASADASEDRMRSDHAAPGDDTFVDLVFEVGSGIFRVLRTPRFERPKQRGTGTTTQQASVRLWRLTSPDAPDDGEPMSTRLDEAGAELTRIVGLDRDQFVKTVVLPQGEFARFLRERPEDRRGVLQKVFGTQVYERLERQLATMRVAAQRSLEAARGDVDRAVAGFVGAAHLPDDVAAPLREVVAQAELDADALLAAVDAATSAATSDAEAAALVAAGAAQACTVTERARDVARTTAGVVERRDALLADRERLAGLADAHGRDVERRAVARRARLVMPAVAGVANAEVSEREAVAAVTRTRTAAVARHPDLADLAPATAAVDVQLKALSVERERCTAARARLDRALELEAALPTLLLTVADLTERVELRAAERDALVDRLARRPRERAELRGRRDVLARAAEELGEAQQTLGTVEARRAAALLVAELGPRTADAEEVVRLAAERAASSADHASALRQARIAGIAAELALDLTPGAACPVCGGTEHPHPAAPAAEAVTAEVVRAAEDACATADAVLVEAGRVLTELRTRLADAEAAADGWDVPTADAARAAASDAVTAARAAAVGRDQADAELETFDAGTRVLEQQRADLDREVGESTVALGGRREEIRDARTVVEAARESADTVKARAESLDVRLALVGAWLAEVERLVVALDRKAERAAELAAALAEHGFDDADAATAAALDDAALAALDRRIADHDLAVARVTEGLADAAVAALPAALTAEAARTALAEATAAHAAADAEAARATGELARLRDRAAASAAGRGRVGDALGALAAARESAGPVVRMANLAAASSGENTRQLSLGTYVLARRFEDVVAAANGRLAAMSSGRYELLRSDERERGGARKLGLALAVVDHHTERQRDPSTLSGGETFYFALALALGLADVVTAEAGGTDLGTLFVDEGFGSLDGDTLDVVLAELGRLRDSGRVVGVVSHVDAMKQAIAERVEVRRTAQGWSTLAVRA